VTDTKTRRVVPANRKADETHDASSSHGQNPPDGDIHAVPSDTVYTIRVRPRYIGGWAYKL